MKVKDDRAPEATSPFSGTCPVAPQHAFEVAKLAAFMRKHVRGFAGELEVEPFEGGRRNPSLRRAAGRRRHLLRRGPPGALLPSAHAVERGFRAMQALAATAVPVAHVHALGEDPVVSGTACHVMDCVDGRIPWNPTLPGLGTPERAAHDDEMNRAVAALHRIGPAAIGLADHGRPGHASSAQASRT
ncbi:MAG: phosphotransferase [Burkholderiaceae bacterium]|nr:phosphotransferase [Burkholderiaceae bacterium]